jgi:hypothetical protein
MKHTLKQIVNGNEATFSYACAGKVYYEIKVEDSIYQLEIDALEDEWKTTYLLPKFKAITLMRWIRSGMDNEKLIQIK